MMPEAVRAQTFKKTKMTEGITKLLKIRIYFSTNLGKAKSNRRRRNSINHWHAAMKNNLMMRIWLRWKKTKKMVHLNHKKSGVVVVQRVPSPAHDTNK
jgi:hypothetical protein